MNETAAELLAAYDSQLRGSVPNPLPEGWSVEGDGPIVRFRMGSGRGWILYRDLGGLDGAELDELIARQVRAFEGSTEKLEWKYHAHDLPRDLPDRLVANGFVPEDLETIEIGRVADMTGPVRPPEGVTLREVTSRRDIDRIADLEAAVWNEDYDGFAESLHAELEANPAAMTIVVAEAGELMVSAAWIRFEAGTEFATMWGGATLAEWRGRGIYRALVAYRANLAAERGFRYLEVDASKDSRPILERLGFVPVTTSTPYVWAPRAS
jgi:GNAT superfamily N-acetyltransferase